MNVERTTVTPPTRRARPTGRRAVSLTLALIALLALAFAPVSAADGPRASEMMVAETVAASIDGFGERVPASSGVVDRVNRRLSSLFGGSDPEVPGVRASAAVASPMPFTSVGFELPEGADGVWFRTHGPEGWSSWTHLEAIDLDDGPDPGTDEAADAVDREFSELAWVGEATHLEVDTAAGYPVGGVTAHVADTMGLAGGPVETVTGLLSDAGEEARGRPDVIRRSQWGANENWRRGNPRYAEVGQGIVHHTATRNYYSRDEAPAIVRSIYHYHTQVLGWADIGYNLLVDRFGRIYEGRAGGLERGVVGAHARGHNTGTFGISVIGNYHDAPARQVAFDALTDAIDWQFDVHGISGRGTYQGRSTLIGHRDVGSTVCPGYYLYRRLGEIRSAVG